MRMGSIKPHKLTLFVSGLISSFMMIKKDKTLASTSNVTNYKIHEISSFLGSLAEMDNFFLFSFSL